mmetsp:Transcript_1396/g.2943  ORF Transcript_1396/g.2943 Transcript_1396/m.2943 type:complete len:95 (-) Transcript_1396:155-439(-)
MSTRTNTNRSISGNAYRLYVASERSTNNNNNNNNNNNEPQQQRQRSTTGTTSAGQRLYPPITGLVLVGYRQGGKQGGACIPYGSIRTSSTVRRS